MSLLTTGSEPFRVAKSKTSESSDALRTRIERELPTLSILLLIACIDDSCLRAVAPSREDNCWIRCRAASNAWTAVLSLSCLHGFILEIGQPRKQLISGSHDVLPCINVESTTMREVWTKEPGGVSCACNTGKDNRGWNRVNPWMMWTETSFAWLMQTWCRQLSRDLVSTRSVCAMSGSADPCSTLHATCWRHEKNLAGTTLPRKRPQQQTYRTTKC